LLNLKAANEEYILCVIIIFLYVSLKIVVTDVLVVALYNLYTLFKHYSRFYNINKNLVKSINQGYE